jgi:hypothetical protein
MTKEEFRNRIGIEITSHWQENVIDELLDEYTASYAKQQAIAFAGWVTNEYSQSLRAESPILTDEEIYNQFIEQQNKS